MEESGHHLARGVLYTWQGGGRLSFCFPKASFGPDLSAPGGAGLRGRCVSRCRCFRVRRIDLTVLRKHLLMGICLLLAWPIPSAKDHQDPPAVLGTARHLSRKVS